MRDHTKLKVFQLADQLALAVYSESAQLRRAAVSVASNIVEGCSRSTQADYARFIEIAYGSSRELQYQTSLCIRLGFVSTTAGQKLHCACTETAKALNGLLRALHGPRLPR